jgi:hypothetical protein
VDQRIKRDQRARALGITAHQGQQLSEAVTHPGSLVGVEVAEGLDRSDPRCPSATPSAPKRPRRRRYLADDAHAAEIDQPVAVLELVVLAERDTR